jgi:hypothetical protein
MNPQQAQTARGGYRLLNRVCVSDRIVDRQVPMRHREHRAAAAR